MSGAVQLAFDGAEVPAESVRTRAQQATVSPTQDGVMRHIGEHGFIRPVDAGRILYFNQGTPWRERYASSDGSEVLRRMAKRGLVHKEGPGRWVAGPGEPVKLRGSERVRKGLPRWEDEEAKE